MRLRPIEQMIDRVAKWIPDAERRRAFRRAAPRLRWQLWHARRDIGQNLVAGSERARVGSGWIANPPSLLVSAPPRRSKRWRAHGRSDVSSAILPMSF